LTYIDERNTFLLLSLCLRVLESLGATGAMVAAFSLTAVSFPESVASTFVRIFNIVYIVITVEPTFCPPTANDSSTRKIIQIWSSTQSFWIFHGFENFHQTIKLLWLIIIIKKIVTVHYHILYFFNSGSIV